MKAARVQAAVALCNLSYPTSCTISQITGVVKRTRHVFALTTTIRQIDTSRRVVLRFLGQDMHRPPRRAPPHTKNGGAARRASVAGADGSRTHLGHSSHPTLVLKTREPTGTQPPPRQHHYTRFAVCTQGERTWRLDASSWQWNARKTSRRLIATLPTRERTLLGEQGRNLREVGADA